MWSGRSESTGHQDHEGGRFDWGSVTGWDTGVLLSDPSNVGEPGKVSFLFYRYGPDGNSQYGGLILKTADGKERYFASDIMKVADSGEFAGPRGYLPGVTRALYPDYKPRIPETIAFSAADKGDSMSRCNRSAGLSSTAFPSSSLQERSAR